MGTLQEVSRCLVCRGKLCERQVTRMQEYGGYWVVIENLPALVCAQCGETCTTPSLPLSCVRRGGRGVRLTSRASASNAGVVQISRAARLTPPRPPLRPGPCGT